MRATLLLLVSLPALAQAATLRTAVTLSGPAVHLSDLFDNAGADADRILGPGPAPGGRIIVEAAQLAAIARQFGVDWRPASDADRSVLSWPGKPFPHAAALSALRPALVAAGAPKQADITLSDFAPPMIPADAAPVATVSDIDFDASSGRFSATLAVGAGASAQSFRVSGYARETVTVPVPVRRLLPGDVIAADDLRITHIPTDRLREEVAREPTQAVGMTVRHFAPEGAPLALADLERPPVVAKGARVRVTLSGNGLELSTQGVALDQGAIGAQIQVMNPSSHAVLLAEVTGMGMVRIEPGSTPLIPPARFTGNALASAATYAGGSAR